jgi:hypothetical protein
VALLFRVSLRSMSWDTFLFRASIVWLLISRGRNAFHLHVVRCRTEALRMQRCFY